MTDHKLIETDFSSASSMLRKLQSGAQGSDPWLATLAHELREPLNAVLLSLNELLPICAREPSAIAARDAAERGSRHMAKIISDVLELNRNPRLPLRTEWCDLREIVAGSIEIARPLFADGRHYLSVLLPPDPVSLRAHPARLQQILTNLLTNAAKFTPPGGQISLIVDALEGELQIRIRDNGIGIEPQLLPHIFDLYRQGNARARRHRDGLGIGLALVKSLVELHGGSVAAYSDGPGRGSEFVVRLPMAPNEY